MKSVVTKTVKSVLIFKLSVVTKTVRELIELADVKHLGDVGHLQRIDISHLPTGVYYLRVGKSTKMLVVV